jgi:hypothetical protein
MVGVVAPPPQAERITSSTLMPTHVTCNGHSTLHFHFVTLPGCWNVLLGRTHPSFNMLHYLQQLTRMWPT